MFERSLLQTQPTQRWTTIVSITLQCSIAAAILATPLLHPASLVFHTEAPKLFIPLKNAPPQLPRVVTATIAPAASSPAPAASSPAPAGHAFLLTSLKPNSGEDAPPHLGPIGNMGSGDSTGLGVDSLGTAHNGPSIAVIPATSARPLPVSSGVIAGLLLSPIKPIYPRIAIATRTEGTVIVEAIISRSGKIESAHATAGPDILREAAIDAICNARYSPYLLNGTPTEVQTTITVIFRLAN